MLGSRTVALPICTLNPSRSYGGGEGAAIEEPKGIEEHKQPSYCITSQVYRFSILFNSVTLPNANGDYYYYYYHIIHFWISIFK
ncbi:hypothetical protein VNO80_22465 [Phaseolus coccineus]|uniref:Uncharacterized protein n=1 Tax=Phaseolus coccineus TaxID=3886 RepID=A0AAN9M4Y1_PHACN